MAVLDARDLVVLYGPTTVLDDVTVTIAPRRGWASSAPTASASRRCCGSSPAEVRAEEGSVVRTPPAATVGYLPQEPDRSPGRDAGRRPRPAHGRGRRRRGARAQPPRRWPRRAPGADDRYAAALDRWLALGGADFDGPGRRGAAPTSACRRDRLDAEPTGTLSGGQAARASLAAVLLSRFDVLLLDEPTNDLDFDGLDRLERFVDERPAPSWRRVPRPGLPRARGRPSARARRAQPPGHRVRRRLAAYLEARATARRHAEEAHGAYVRRASDRSKDRARRQRHGRTPACASRRSARTTTTSPCATGATTAPRSRRPRRGPASRPSSG